MITRPCCKRKEKPCIANKKDVYKYSPTWQLKGQRIRQGEKDKEMQKIKYKPG
jgi:hypothetical protein